MSGFGSNKQSLKNKNNIFEKDRLITYALEMHQKGNIKEAKGCYQKILKKGIADPRVFTNLGLIFQVENDYERAIKLYKKSIISFPGSHEAYSNLSRILLEIGKYDLAEKYLIKVIRLKPKFLMAHQNLFNVYMKSNKRKKARDVLHECLKIAPNNPLIISNIGRFLLEEGNLDEAKKYLKKAINLKSDFWIPYNNLAILEATMGNLLEAEKNFQYVIDINPNYVEAYVSLGEIKNDLSKINEAETFFLKSLEIKKDFVNGYSSLFRFYEKTNNLIKLKEQLNINESNPLIKNELLMYRARVFFREKNFSKAKELIDEVALNWVEKTDANTRLNFWSFKAFIEEKSQNFNEAFDAFTKSQLNTKYEKCNKTEFKNYIINYEKNLNNKNFFLKRDSFFKEKNKVCFLIGFPRSGTTLLDTVLRSHPEIDVIEEKPIIYSLEKIIKNQFRYQLEEIYKLNEIQVEKLRKNYLENILKLSDKKDSQIIVDKFPLQTVSLPLINFIFPKAKIIFAHRHPYDTILSCFQQSFEPNNAMANFRSLRESSEIYNLSMKMWVRYKQDLNLNYTMSKYESLINNFEIHTKKIMNFLEIEWDSSIKNYRETALSRQKINTPSSSQVVQPIYKSSIAKWENYKTYFYDCHVFLEEWIKYFKY